MPEQSILKIPERLSWSWYLGGLTSLAAAGLVKGLRSYFRGRLHTEDSAVWDAEAQTLTIRFAPMGRGYFEDLSCEAFPNRRGPGPTRDGMLLDQIGSYVNGYWQAETVRREAAKPYDSSWVPASGARMEWDAMKAEEGNRTLQEQYEEWYRTVGRPLEDLRMMRRHE